MITYFATFGALCLSAFATSGRRQQATMLFVMLVFLWWFMGTRYYVGCDFTGYLRRFNNFSDPATFGDLLQRPEWGYESLVWLVKALNLDYVWTNILAALAYVAGFYTLFRRHPSSLYLLATAFPVMMIQLGMSGTRQGLAVAFLMFAYEQFRQKRRLGTGLFILIAMQFHSSAIIFLPLALLAGHEVSTRRVVLALATLGPIAAFLLADRFEVYSDRYIEDRYGSLDSNGALFRYLLILLPALLYLRHKEDLRFHFSRDFSLMKITSLATFAILPIALVNTTILHRLIYYLMPASILTFVSVGYFVFGRSEKAFGLSLPIIVYFCYMLAWFAMSRHADICYTPYRSYSLN